MDCPKLFGASSPVLDVDEVSGIVDRLNQGASKIADLMTALGPLLTDPDASKRQLGCQCLSQVLVRLRDDLLDAAEIHFLVTFLIDRLQDSPLMFSPVVEAFSALGALDALQDADLHQLTRSLLFDLHCQSLTLKDRAKILDLLRLGLSPSRLDPLLHSPLAKEYLHGFLQCVEGETNPRNLKVIFDCWTILLTHLDCSIFLEDIFETLSCYFPIDFNQPKNNPHSVTREDLSAGLESSLASTDKFAPLAIPLFLEKLSSDLTEAKRDALAALRICLAKYSPAQLAPFLKDIWNGCKQEIMGIRASHSDPGVVEQAHRLLEALTARLGSAIQSPVNHGILNDWIGLVWADLKSFLKFLESNLMETAVEILARVASADKIVGDDLVHRSLPVLIEVTEKSEDQARILDLASRLLRTKPIRGKTSPDFAPSFLSLCEKCLEQDERSVRDAASRALRFGRQSMNYSLIEDRLSRAFALSVQDRDYLGVAERAELTLAMTDLDEAKVEAWIRSVMPIGVARGGEANIQILVALACRKEQYVKMVFPGLLEAIQIPDLRPFAIGAMGQICSKSSEDQYEYFTTEQDMLSRIILDVKDIAKEEEIEQCQSLLRLLGRKMLTLKHVENLQQQVLKNFSREDETSSSPCPLLEALLCSLPVNIVNGLDWSSVFRTAATQTNNRKDVFKVLGTVLNKSSDILEQHMSDLKALENSDHVGEVFFSLRRTRKKVRFEFHIFHSLSLSQLSSPRVF